MAVKKQQVNGNSDVNFEELKRWFWVYSKYMDRFPLLLVLSLFATLAQDTLWPSFAKGEEKILVSVSVLVPSKYRASIASTLIL